MRFICCSEWLSGTKWSTCCGCCIACCWQLFDMRKTSVLFPAVSPILHFFLNEWVTDLMRAVTSKDVPYKCAGIWNICPWHSHERAHNRFLLIDEGPRHNAAELFNAGLFIHVFSAMSYIYVPKQRQTRQNCPTVSVVVEQIKTRDPFSEWTQKKCCFCLIRCWFCCSYSLHDSISRHYIGIFSVSHCC